MNSFKTQCQTVAGSIKAWPVWSWLVKGFKGICFTLGLFSLLSIVFWGAVIGSLFNAPETAPLPDEMAIYMTLKGEIAETAQPDIFASPFEEQAPLLHDIIAVIDQAAKDQRVKALVVKLKSPQISLAHVQELRAAITRFKDAGKKTYIFAANYGGASMADMYLASAFDARYIQPLGTVSMAGVKIEMPFFRKLLDKIGVQPDFHQRKAYKTAYESLTNKHISKANKETVTHILDVIRGQIVPDMAQDLGQSDKSIQSAIDLGVFTAPDAIEKGLITKALYSNEVLGEIKNALGFSNRADEDVFVPASALMPKQDNLDRILQAEEQAITPKLAIIHVDGAIVVDNPDGMPGNAAASKIVPLITKAAEDKSVKAIVVRVNSPGGSAVASDMILQALTRAKTEKPVIVSMGGMAASGGYWIASGADSIFASPLTLTGSIGVVGGKIATQKLWDHLDIQWDTAAQWGDNAGIWSGRTAFSKAEAQRVHVMLDYIYDQFIARVSEGRNMELSAVEEVAQGRVWPGISAQEKGLVDTLGGLNDAVMFAANQAGYDDLDQLDIVTMPRPLTAFEQILQLLSSTDGMVKAVRAVSYFGDVLHYGLKAHSADLLAVQSGGEPLALAR